MFVRILLASFLPILGTPSSVRSLWVKSQKALQSGSFVRANSVSVFVSGSIADNAFLFAGFWDSISCWEDHLKGKQHGNF